MGKNSQSQIDEDFMKNSTRLGFITIGRGVNVEVQETKYASSMYVLNTLFQDIVNFL